MALRVPASLVRHPYFVPVVGALLSIAALWTFGRPRPEIERARRHFVELQQQRAIAQTRQDARAEFRRRAGEVREQLATASQDRRGALNDALAELWTRQLWSSKTAVRDAVLTTPLITRPGMLPVPGTVPVYSARRAGCASCHVAVATPGFESFPEPFRTHVQLSSYVGADSPHPPSRMGCAVCHHGNDDGESFTDAGHSTLRVRVRPDEWRRSMSDGVDARGIVIDEGQWTAPNAQGAMLPVGHVGAGCARCHAGERLQPGAATRNDALTSMDRAGCYGCHGVPGLEPLPKRGPDLRRIASKLTPQWTRQWVADPAALKPTTWMPRFWRDRSVLQSDDRVEVDAVVAYLFASADTSVPAAARPPRGDAARGQRLVASVGCLGCHVVGAADRDTTNLARTFGPPLQGIGSKTTDVWLYDWIRDPQRYSPGTRMPRLRVTDAEAADIATYLASLTANALDTGAPEKTDPSAYREVVRRYAALGAAAPHDLDALSLDATRQAAGRAVIEVRGCFNCHEIRGFEGKRTTTRLAGIEGDSNHVHHRAPAERPATLSGDMNAGRGQPGAPADLTRPSYQLGPVEWARVALGAAITAHQQPDDRRITVPWHVAKTSGRALVQRFNCTGCHAVDGTGGDGLAALPPEAGRAPALDPVGSRMTVAQLRAYLRDPGASASGPSLRMPSFTLTEDEVAALSGYLQAIAPAATAPAPAASQPAPSPRSSAR